MTNTTAATEPSFYESYQAIVGNPNLTEQQRDTLITQLVGGWGGEKIKAMCLSIQPADRYPILVTPPAVFVTKFRDIVEVFSRDDVFSVSAYGERMAVTTGAFMLGMQPGAQYQHDHSAVLLAMPQTDLVGARRWISKDAAGLVGALAKKDDQIDVVADIAYAVPPRFVAHYFGVPGPVSPLFLFWLEILAAYIFNFSTGSPEADEKLRTAASSAGLAFQTYIDGLIQRRIADMGAGKEVPQDVMTRMLKAGILDPVAIRANLGGLSIGCTMPPCGTIAFALDVVMRLNDEGDPLYNPAAYDTVIQAAKDNDPTLLERCMLEAARLGLPEPPSLFRTATQDYRLAKGEARETMILEGSTVVVVPSAGMMDPDMIDSPHEFRLDRPEWSYLMFGQGTHECLGRKLGKILVAEAVRPILSLKNLRRAPGPEGTLKMGDSFPASAYPAHMVLEFDPS